MRFSSTLSVANTERPSGAWAMPAVAKSCAGLPREVLPLTSTRPADGGEQAGRDSGHRGLARAVRTDERERLGSWMANDTPNRAWNGP